MYIKRKIEAMEEGWNEIFINGILIHLLAFAPSISFPCKAVINNKRITSGKIINDNPLRYL